MISKRELLDVIFTETVEDGEKDRSFSGLDLELNRKIPTAFTAGACPGCGVVKDSATLPEE